MSRVLHSLIGGALLLAATAAAAEDLYKNGNWSAMSADDKAYSRGDLVTIVIFQAAEASNSATNSSRRKTEVGGSIDVGGIDEGGSVEFGGSFTGRGEVRRSERLVAQITAVVQEVLPNGDFAIIGEQTMRINGETTRIGVSGRIRRADISADNRVLSSRIADARINYDGRGFVSRSAKPGIVNRIFNFLGLV
jgi:flagellar L-ring protein precursor FlgH